MIDSIQKIWYLEKFDLIKELPLDARIELDRCGIVHRNFKKEVIYFEDSISDLVFFLKMGRVKISKVSTDGKETTLFVVQPGEIFGEMALIGSERHSHRAEALDEVLLCAFSMENFKTILDSYPELSRRVFKRIGDRLQTVEQKLADLVFKGADYRVIRFLVDMGRPTLVKSVDEAWVKPFFTHEEIAHLTATSRQTVTTVLNDLKKEELIRFWRNKLYIRQFSELEKRLS